jgi:hypothetical protein
MLIEVVIWFDVYGINSGDDKYRYKTHILQPDGF